MFALNTRYCVAVYKDKDGNFYTEPVIGWLTLSDPDDGPYVIAQVYDDWVGLIPPDTNTDFVALSFSEDDDYCDLAPCEDRDEDRDIN